MRKRSAADRSWIAHLALVALLLLPVAAFALPALDVEGPAFLVGDGEQAAAPVAAPTAAAAATASRREARGDCAPFRRRRRRSAGCCRRADRLVVLGLCFSPPLCSSCLP